MLACYARSIFNEWEDLNSLAKSKMHTNLIAIAVTESWLTTDIESTLILLPGFQCFRRYLAKRLFDAETATFIKQRWCSSPKLFFTYAKDIIEITAVACRTKLSCKISSFTLCSIHIPSSSRVSQLTIFYLFSFGVLPVLLKHVLSVWKQYTLQP